MTSGEEDMEEAGSEAPLSDSAVGEPAAETGDKVLEAKCVEEPEVPADGPEKRLQEVQDRYLRLAADFDNYRKRQARERGEVVLMANESLIGGLLPVLDNLERAIAAMLGARENRQGVESVLKGVELTLRMFQGTIAGAGVERMQAYGEVFDPHRHEAVGQVETNDSPPDTVVEEMEAGYLLNGRVLRPAKVKVARPPAKRNGIIKEEADA